MGSTAPILVFFFFFFDIESFYYKKVLIEDYKYKITIGNNFIRFQYDYFSFL